MGCNQCGGTGKEPTGKYCRCAEGRIKKRMDEANEKAAKAKEEKRDLTHREKLSEVKKIFKEGNLFDPQIYEFKIGDWVEIARLDHDLNGAIGIIENIEDGEIFVRFRNYRHKERNLNGRKWFDAKNLNLAPVDVGIFKNQLIDLALDMGDQVWFDEIVSAKAASK